MVKFQRSSLPGVRSLTRRQHRLRRATRHSDEVVRRMAAAATSAAATGKEAFFWRRKFGDLWDVHGAKKWIYGDLRLDKMTLFQMI
jgi:hypothetical protein